MMQLTLKKFLSFVDHHGYALMPASRCIGHVLFYVELALADEDNWRNELKLYHVHSFSQ